MQTIIVKTIIQLTMAIGLLVAGFAVGFPIGQNAGFTTGSEWALLQAGLIAKEAGVFMPIRYEEGIFRVTLKQPKHLYKRSWELADKYSETKADGNNRGNTPSRENADRKLASDVNFFSGSVMINYLFADSRCEDTGTNRVF